MGGAVTIIPPGTRLPAGEPEIGRRRFPTREARDRAIVELAQIGISPAVIETRIAVSRGVIYAVIARARRDGAAIPYFSTSGAPRGASRARTIDVGTGLLVRLQAIAARRGTTAADLGRRLLERIVADDLVNAVLDDEGDDE